MLYRFLKGIKFTKLTIWISLLFLSFSSPQSSKSINWGFVGHKKINYQAVFTLPPEMLQFYKKNIDYLSENSVLPDKRRYILKSEAPKHYIDLDHYQNDSLDLYESVPKGWRSAKELFSEDTLQAYGILPWNIQWQLRNLEKAFKNKDPHLILKYSAEIGHYIADAHVPLHTTENYNGQFSNQHGIHGLWESRLVELYKDEYDFFVGKAILERDPLEKTWNVIKESHTLLDEVFSLEKIASDSIGEDKKYSFELIGKNLKKVYSADFSDLYHRLMKGMVEKRMRDAVLTVGSFWFTAWVNAGQPDLNDMSIKKETLESETKDLENLYKKQKQIKGRVHE